MKLARLTWLAAVGSAPLIFLAVLYSIRSDRNLTTVFIYGMGVFFCTGVVLARRRRVVGLALIAAVAIAILLVLQSAEWEWVEIDRKVRFRVTAKHDGRPVANARVSLGNRTRYRRGASYGVTNADGDTILNHPFTGSIQYSLVEFTSDIRSWQAILHVDADGYQTYSGPLMAWISAIDPTPYKVDIELEK